MSLTGRVLIVAGSDSGGGAGIQADIKTVTALGAYAMTAVTALTAQSTKGVFGIHDVPAAFVAEQMRLVLRDIGADAIKLGMLHRADIIDVVCDVLAAEAPDVPVVVDPVMVAKGGEALLADDAVEAVRTRVVPFARILTPNLPEAAALVGGIAEDTDPAELAARVLALGPGAVLLKGGHAEGRTIVDVLAERGEPPRRYESARIATVHTHGTGCTLASAVATGIAQGLALRDAVVRARAYVLEAIRRAPGYGHGRGPLDHAHTVRPFAAERR